MVRHIPNFITLLNVFCGCVATVFAVLNQLEYAAFFVFVGIIFDFFDGLAARWLNAKSELGLQLDSLADVITCGVVPGIVMFQLLGMGMDGGWNVEVHKEAVSSMFWTGLKVRPLPFIGFLITMAAAYRLARFNIDDTQTDSFVGLPTPANALLIVSLPLILLYHGNDFLNQWILNPWFLVALTFLSVYLMNSRLRLFALKFKSWGFAENAHRYLFVVICAVLLITLRFLAVPFIILLYLGMSVLMELGKNR
ncbi:MAG: phosphatidylcholine/phosphatidylserine synthase [Flavobacteriaceae bacterium]